MTPVADTLIESWSWAAAPPPDITVSEWADAKRVLPRASGAQGARWRTATAPYLRGIMDVVHEPETTAAAVEKASQTGGSEALHNIVGYFIEYRPCAMLFVHPTAGDAEEWSKDRLADMIRSTPALRDVVQDKRQPSGSHEAESTLTMKIYPGGSLVIGGANTPNTYARRAVRVTYADDYDRFPPVVGDEGDPGDLLVNRTESFYDGLSIFVSTPTLKGGRIDTLYNRSDQRRYFVPCPHCGRMDWITWSDPAHFRVVFTDRDPETARLACPDDEHGGCGAQMSEPERRAMISAGEWRPTAVAKQKGLAGFHLPAMLSTIGTRTLQSLADKWLSAREKGKESLKVFVNTQLAEGWEDRTVRMDPHGLMARRESYGAEGVEIPAAASALTCGVDAQGDRFELQVVAWGPGSERWVVDYRVVPGDPKKAETRAALLEALSRKYLHASGHMLPIHATCIDTGYASEDLYDFVLAYQVRRIYATKGFAGKSGEPIVGKPTQKRYGKSPRPVLLWPINVDDAKSDIVASLALVAAGPGSTHFPALDTINEEYFAGLCSEHKETRYNKSNVATHTVWVQDRERNEPFDTMGENLAAYKLLNPNLRQMAEILAATTPAPPIPTGETPAPPAPPRVKPPRTAPSTYVRQ